MTYTIFQIVNFLVTIVLVYLLWNKKYVTHIHLTTVIDHTGKVLAKIEKPLDDVLNSDQEAQASVASKAP
jgi:hypothetical protein